MRRILLTSSQVSVLVSSFVVVSCTLALFLSGYVIQQRTLRDLRTAIRPRQPRPKPLIYLPDQFKEQNKKQQEEELAQEKEEKEASERRIKLVEISPSTPDTVENAAKKKRAAGQNVSAKKMAMLEELQASVSQHAWGVEHPDPLVKSKVPISAAERRRLIKEELQRLSQADEPIYYQRRVY